MTDRGTILDTAPKLSDSMFAVNLGSMSARAGQPFTATCCAYDGSPHPLAFL